MQDTDELGGALGADGSQAPTGAYGAAPLPPMPRAAGLPPAGASSSSSLASIAANQPPPRALGGLSVSLGRGSGGGANAAANAAGASSASLVRALHRMQLCGAADAQALAASPDEP